MLAAPLSRRRVVQGGATALAVLARPGRWTGGPPRVARAGPGPAGHRPVLGLPATAAEYVDPALLKRLALAAMDAAKTAGATYADIRLTRTVDRTTEQFGVGVRCLVKGYWGFAASAVWTVDEMAALAQSAAARATAYAKGPPRAMEWAPVPVVTGDWRTPIEIDPLTIPLEEAGDFMGSMDHGARPQRLMLDWIARHQSDIATISEDDWRRALLYARGPRGPAGTSSGSRQEQAIATSEGTYVTQTLYTGGLGWEANRDAAARYAAELPARWEDMLRHVGLPVKPVELGRYDLVLDGQAAAALVAGTLGKATQLDRALGYEANASGTSYLGPDPLALLGSYQAASEHVTLTANRSMPQWQATVQWDAEGVVPEEATLIKDGILVDYQTTREQAGWLAPYYRKAGKPIKGHGYAGMGTALDEPIQHTPNLVLAPGQPGTSVEAMIKSVKKGIYFEYGGGVDTDFQAKTGTLEGTGFFEREIVNGKLGARLTGCRVRFSAPELWKQVVAVGGAGEADLGGGSDAKGQPAQGTSYTVQGVPLLITNQAVVR